MDERTSVEGLINPEVSEMLHLLVFNLPGTDAPSQRGLDPKPVALNLLQELDEEEEVVLLQDGATAENCLFVLTRENVWRLEPEVFKVRPQYDDRWLSWRLTALGSSRGGKYSETREQRWMDVQERDEDHLRVLVNVLYEVQGVEFFAGFDSPTAVGDSASVRRQMRALARG